MAKVQLYVYEVTKGLAAQLSTAILGRRIPGIWHTGVVCYGMEYFFGSGGIQNIHPGTTVVGAPDEIIDLGETQITDALFHEYLFSIGENRFRPEKYHLFDHNCNTFSNEVAQFLTGKSIPSYILDLPNEVANTPMGAMLKTFMDGVGSPIGSQASSASQYFSGHQPSSSTSSLAPRPNKGRSVEQNISATNSPVIITYEVEDCRRRLPQLFRLETRKLNLIKDLIKNGAVDDKSTSEIVEALYTLFSFLEVNKDADRCILLIDVLSILTQRKQLSVFKSNEGIELVNRILKFCSSLVSNTDVMQSILKLAINVYSETERRLKFTDGKSSLYSDVNKSVMAHCVEILVGEARNTDADDFAVSLAFNMSLSKMNEEAALELASALLHWISSVDKESTSGKRSIATIRQLIKSNHQIKDLAEMTIDCSLLE